MIQRFRVQELQGEEEIRTLKRKANSTERKTNGCDSSGGDVLKLR